jgi:hypothetical protein
MFYLISFSLIFNYLSPNVEVYFIGKLRRFSKRIASQMINPIINKNSYNSLSSTTTYTTSVPS